VTEVVYARVPGSLKQALEAHAGERGLTLTAAVVELLRHGLEAIASAPSLSELERQLAACRSERGQLRARLQEAELRLEAARERQEIAAQSYRALAERTRQQLARCSRCPNPSCGTALSSLLLPAPRAGVDANEYLALLGALGVLVGLAQAADRRATGESSLERT
jgi:hypothetical protein